MQVTENENANTPKIKTKGFFHEYWRMTESVSTDGAYLAYTRRRTRETKSGKKEGDDGQGRKKTGEEASAKKLSAPAADTRPAL